MGIFRVPQINLIMLLALRITIIDKCFRTLFCVCEREQGGDYVAKKVFVFVIIVVVLTIFFLIKTTGGYLFTHEKI